jgi:rhodanese-related sulfurtransferase
MKHWSLAAVATGLLAASIATAAPPMVTPQQVHELQVKKDPSLLVIDVRSPEEFAAGHVPGAVNIPHDLVASRLAEIPKDKEVVLYCRSGRRSGLAAETLEANGYKDLRLMQGDMPGWEKAGLPVEGAGPKPAG